MRATLERLSANHEHSKNRRGLNGYATSQLDEIAEQAGYTTRVCMFDCAKGRRCFTMTFYRKSKLDWLYSAWDSTIDFFRSW
jgi:hypothetical protein